MQTILLIFFPHQKYEFIQHAEIYPFNVFAIMPSYLGITALQIPSILTSVSHARAAHIQLVGLSRIFVTQLEVALELKVEFELCTSPD